MDKTGLILILMVSLSFSACYNVASPPSNTTISVNPLTYDCIYDLTTNTTYNITIPKTSNLMAVDYSHNFTDVQNNTYFANRATIDPTYRLNDAVTIPFNETRTNPITNTVYSVSLAPEVRNATVGNSVTARGIVFSCFPGNFTPINTTLDVGQSTTINNNTVICRLQPQAPVNLTSPQSVSLYNGSLVFNCRDNIPRNINLTLTDGQVYFENTTNTTIRPFNYKQNLVWNLTMESTQHNDVCNITAIAPTRQSLYRGGTIAVGVDQSSTDILSGTNYTGPTLDQIPYKKTNVMVNFTAPQTGVEPLTNTTFSCNVPLFPVNITYGDASQFTARVSLDYFNKYCNEDEKKNASLDKCVERLASPEVWTQRVNATEQLTQQCYKDKSDILQNATLCNAALTGNKAASDNMLLLVGGLIFVVGAIIALGLVIIYYKKNIKPPVRTQRPIPSRGMDMEDYFAKKNNVLPTKPDPADNKLFLPEGFDE